MLNLIWLLKNGAYLLPAIAIWVALYIPYLPFYILHIDTAVYLIGAKLVQGGYLPYLHFWDHKPPLVYYLYAAAMSMGGSLGTRSVNVLTLLFLIASTVLLYLLALKMTRRPLCAMMCSALYPLLSFLLVSADAINPNTEIYMETFSLAALLAGYTALFSNRIRLFAVAGVCIGLATACKQPSGVLLPFLCAMAVVQSWADGRKYRRMITAVVLLVAGTAVVWVLIGLYFYLRGGFREFMFQCFQFNMIYSSTMGASIQFLNFLEMLIFFCKRFPLFGVFYCAGLVSTIAAIVVPSVSFHRRLTYLFLLFWHCADAVGTSAGGILFPHYYMQWMPSLAVVMCLPVAELIGDLLKSRRRLACVPVGAYCIYLAGLIFFSTEPIYIEQTWWFYPLRERISMISQWKSVFGSDYYRIPLFFRTKYTPELNVIISDVRKFARKDEPIQVWGFMPDLYLLAGKKPASRFIYTTPISGDFVGLSNLYRRKPTPELKDIHARHRDQLIADLQASAPPVILATENYITPQTEFFWEYLTAHYSLYRHASMQISIYVRNDRIAEQGHTHDCSLHHH
ncbi:MAG: glycosyltransferase family 39 protein [Candidatus Auribacterota bacterium]